MIGFPGSLYDGEGVSLVSGLPDLTREQVAEHPRRSVVGRDEMNPVGQIWVLANDAEFLAAPRAFRDVAIAMVSAGRAVLILSRRPEAGADVRDGLLEAFARADAFPDAAGFA